ncbi:hypothetical protein GTP90_35660, partial [Rugamonas sp. FT81W]|nr:hypothetical protein [Duganella vulcania]
NAARMADVLRQVRELGQDAAGAQADSDVLRLKALQGGAGHGVLAVPK